ncbi:hypothetical protein AWB79_04073 [Caballeronia hypogeia]|uniref:Uncharacterized protein n=1 Tax=Caballeronia hypogeia TaxID=1777140 RepID=A0A158BQF1_9BURK|nr:hypothetical protein [Caballeronia hypogeia]SAK72273.1 hypothetical protein AWB79_04073 [Caballeronia hypogeia]
MSSLSIRDLAHSQELDRRAMSAVSGGQGFGGFANVNVNIVQNIAQLQNVQVNALNDIGVIGPNFQAPSFDVSPKQIGKTNLDLSF